MINISRKKIGTVLLFATDTITIFAIIQTAIFLRKSILPFFIQFPEFPSLNVTFFWWVFPVWIFFLFYEGLYTKRFSFWDEVQVLWKVAFLSTFAVFTILYLGKFGEQVSRTVLVAMSIISFPVLRIENRPF